MKILFTGRKTRISRGLKSFAEEKLGKVQRILGTIDDAHVILTLEKHRCKSEIIVKARAATLTARSESDNFQEAVMQSVDRLMVQAKKHHDRIRERRKGARARTTPRRVGPRRPVTIPAGDGYDRAGVVRMGRVPAKPMSVTEALVQARGSRDPLVVFLNEESQQIAVLYRRSDGRFGLVETEA